MSEQPYIWAQEWSRKQKGLWESQEVGSGGAGKMWGRDPSPGGMG